MRTAMGIVALSLLWPTLGVSQEAGVESQGKNVTETSVTSIYDVTVKDIDGKDVALSTYKGDVLLIVNVASR